MTSKYIGTITNFTIYEQQPGLMEQIIVGYSVFFLAVMIVAPILTYFCVGERAYSDLQPNQRYAPAWKRVVAYIIDIGILWVLQKAIVFLIGLLLLFFGTFGIAASVLLVIGSLFLYWLYFVLFHTSNQQATLGMKVMKIRIYDNQHQRLNFWRATGRFYSAPLSATILFIGVIMVIFTKRKQGLHDLIAKTIHLED